jgi:periplasmic divalent cation tolerance protein
MNSSEKLCWVYMTAGSIEEAKNIGGELIEQNLAACVNLLENMTSIYKWGDKLEEGQEVVMIAKTRKVLMPKLIKTVNSIHSYDCPCILELPIQGGNPEFLSWIETETKVKEEKK